ncbi:phosphatidylserine decarboxylase [Alkaliphilus transvaalensis]|uniref:phosphatidylserine decarboxylase n=1 Tax=Alkaliphilus transvaalensis TaxID=114628 RepID=UPI00068490AE|nr:phosphatidylserine decarboxylase [Alkaliphilus transvaalensis]
MTIKYIERKTGEEVTEIVAGGKVLRWTYETKPGRFLLETIMKRKLFTKIFGIVMDTTFSKKRIQPFVRDLAIDLSEAQKEKIEDYQNFNDFFARHLKQEARPVCSKVDTLASPADGRIFAYENIDINKIVQVKGSHFSLMELIGDQQLALEYEGGICIIVRLAPVDYHRFHFPAKGIPKVAKRIEGHYYSVSPYALRRMTEIYCRNKREITELETDLFDRLLLVEVGATCVGSIVQTYEADKPVIKGQEKGYFKFGGSTTIIFIKKNIVKIDEDIINNTAKGIETKVNMGESIGKKLIND